MMSAPLVIVAETVCEPAAPRILYMLVVGEPYSPAMAVYPKAGIKLLDEETPHQPRSVVPAGAIVAVTLPLLAEPAPNPPSIVLPPPVVEKQDRPKNTPAPATLAVVLVRDPSVTLSASKRA
jgi:hypothetical protein